MCCAASQHGKRSTPPDHHTGLPRLINTYRNCFVAHNFLTSSPEVGSAWLVVESVRLAQGDLVGGFAEGVVEEGYRVKVYVTVVT